MVKKFFRRLIIMLTERYYKNEMNEWRWQLPRHYHHHHHHQHYAEAKPNQPSQYTKVLNNVQHAYT